MPRKLVVCALEKFCATKCVSFRLQPAFVWPSVAIRLGPFCLLVCVIVVSPVVSRSFQFCVVGLSAFTGSFANRLLRKLVVNLSLCEKGVGNVVRGLKPAPSPAGNSKWSSFYKDLYTGPFGVHRLNPWQG
jgi:hypothetical protein